MYENLIKILIFFLFIQFLCELTKFEEEFTLLSVTEDAETISGIAEVELLFL